MEGLVLKYSPLNVHKSNKYKRILVLYSILKLLFIPIENIIDQLTIVNLQNSLDYFVNTIRTKTC